MPRRAKQKTAECAAHGWRCALAGGGSYRSDRCQPVADTPALLALRAMLAAAVAKQHLDDMVQVAKLADAERQRYLARPLAEIDAEYRAALARAEADLAATEAEMRKPRDQEPQAHRDRAADSRTAASAATGAAPRPAQPADDDRASGSGAPEARKANVIPIRSRSRRPRMWTTQAYI